MFSELKESVASQIRANQSVNLFNRNYPETAVLNERFLMDCASLENISAGQQSQLIETAVEQTVSVLYEVNQFLEIEERHKSALRTLYRESLARILGGSGVVSTLRRHQLRLMGLVRSLYPDYMVRRMKECEKIGNAVCDEYSPEFIAAVYGFSIGELPEPILDIGCGSRALLVHALADLGKNAVGMDRNVSGSGGNLLRRSWFDYEFSDNTWNTIIANMSFSNHFRYNLVNRTARVRDYYRMYKKICRSLNIGGNFLYSPAVEEAESVLNKNEFEVSYRKVLGTGLETVTVRRVQ